MVHSPTNKVWFVGECLNCGYDVIEMSDFTREMKDYCIYCTNPSCQFHQAVSVYDDYTEEDLGWLKWHEPNAWTQDDIPQLAKIATREAFLKSAKSGGATIVIDGRIVKITVQIIKDIQQE